MIILDLMLVGMLILALILLSGVKIMSNPKYYKYFRLIMTGFIMYTPILQFIEGYKLGYTGIGPIILFIVVMLLIAIWGCRINKHKYSIHNVKEKDVINIMEKYLERKNIKYEVRSEEIYLLDIRKPIFIRGIMEIILDCTDIKDLDFYNELVEEVRVGIKEIKQRYFPTEGVFYLILVVFFYWIKVTFLK